MCRRGGNLACAPAHYLQFRVWMTCTAWYIRNHTKRTIISKNSNHEFISDINTTEWRSFVLKVKIEESVRRNSNKIRRGVLAHKCNASKISCRGLVDPCTIPPSQSLFAKPGLYSVQKVCVKLVLRLEYSILGLSLWRNKTWTNVIAQETRWATSRYLDVTQASQSVPKRRSFTNSWLDCLQPWGYTAPDLRGDMHAPFMT